MTAAPANTPATSASGLAIAVHDLSKRYGARLALDSVSLKVPVGQLYALLGPNGAGKTTLMHILCTILRADSGSAELMGINIRNDPRAVRRRIGVVFQEPSLDDRLTVEENLDFHGLVYGVPAIVRHQRITEMLELVELKKWRRALVRTLSVGMKRRLEIARALIHNARILFLDEPTVGLDAQSRARVWQYLNDIRMQRQTTIVVTTHYIEEVERCDRVTIMDQGRVLAEDTPAGLKARFGEALIRIEADDETVLEEITADYPGLVHRTPEGLSIVAATGVSPEDMLARYRQRIKAFTVKSASLESVFLSLTGRGLRDQQLRE
jgi:ABC-2 type transport system ATP-binding protein